MQLPSSAGAAFFLSFKNAAGAVFIKKAQMRDF
jgi:hypothetical protein